MSQSWQELLIGDHEQTERVFAAMKGASPPRRAAARRWSAVLRLRPQLRRPVPQHEGGEAPLPAHRAARHAAPGRPAGGHARRARAVAQPARRRSSRWRAPTSPATAPACRRCATCSASTHAAQGALLEGERHPLPDGAARDRRGRRGGGGRRHRGVEAALGPDTRARYYGIAAGDHRGGRARRTSPSALDREVLAAMLNTLPVELSFVDARRHACATSATSTATKIFPRTRGAIGTKVQNCHPQKSVHMVNQILADFKAGKRDVAEFWIDMGAAQGPHPLLAGARRAPASTSAASRRCRT